MNKELWDCKHGHAFCKGRLAFRRSQGKNTPGGVATVILRSSGKGRQILLGKQRGGSNKGQYSIMHGKMDPKDGNCHISLSASSHRQADRSTASPSRSVYP